MTGFLSKARRPRGPARAKLAATDGARYLSGFVFLRSLLPLLLTRLVNRLAARSPQFRARIDDIGFNLLRGAFSVSGISVQTDGRSLPVPYARVERVSLGIRWKDLLRRVLVLSVDVERPHVIVRRPLESAKKPVQENSGTATPQPSSAPGDRWNQKLRRLFPTTIERIDVHDGEVKVQNLPGQNGADIRLRNIDIAARNITNSEKGNGSLKARLNARADALTNGSIRVDADLYPLANDPTFNADLEIRRLNLADLRGVIREASDLNVADGRLDVVAEAAAAEGKILGYVKPAISGLRFEKDPEQKLGGAVKGGFVRGIAHLLKNKERDQIATRVDFSGDITSPGMGVMPAVKNVLKNAFSTAVLPTLEGTVDLPSRKPANLLARPELNPVTPTTDVPLRPSKVKAVIDMLRETVTRWSANKPARLGAALSYYTAFSMAPLLLLAISIAGLIFGREAAQGQIMDQLSGMMGAESAKTIQSMIQAANKPTAGAFATVVGVITLLFGASAVMVELKDALNRMWNVEGAPGFGGFIKDKLLSMGMVIVIGFLLLVSLGVSAGLAAFGQFMGNALPVPESLLHALNFALSLGIVMLLFAAVFKVLPDAKIRWGDVWVGAAITALLFTIGKFLLGMYIGKGAVGSSYGAAGSILVMLLWIYYSAQILYFGAGLTKVYSERFGSGVKPSTDDLPEKIRY